MQVLKFFIFVYLLLGFIYAVYVAIKKTDKWYWFPANWLFGPITVLYLFYITMKGKDLPVNR
jgi:hypothetical protein